MMNEKIIEDGEKLFQSAENLRRSAPDLDALMDSLWELIEEDDLFGQEEVWDLDDESALGKGKWFASAYAYNAGVMSRPKRALKQVGTISIITRLCNSDDMDDATPDWPWLNQACLILGWHPKNNPNDKWGIGNFDPDDDCVACIFHLGNGLWSWRTDDGDNAYFFVLPIFSLRNELDLKRFALRPLKILFDADDPSAVAEDAFHDVHVLMPQSG